MEFTDLPNLLASAVIHGLGFVSDTESPEASNRRWEMSFDLDIRSADDAPEAFKSVYVPSQLTFGGVANIKIDADSMGGDPGFLLIHDVDIREIEGLGSRYCVTVNGDWFTIEVRASTVSVLNRGEGRPVNRIGLNESERNIER